MSVFTADIKGVLDYGPSHSHPGRYFCVLWLDLDNEEQQVDLLFYAVVDDFGDLVRVWS